MTKRELIVALVVFLALVLVVVPPALHVVPSVRGANRTVTLIGFDPQGWNNSNPIITVTQGDTVTMKLSSGDNLPHRFLVDLDGDANPTDTADCPTTDPCSTTFSTSTVITYTFTVSASTPAGNYHYICVIHYPYMVGSFVVQQSTTPDFSISSTPNSLSFVQGSSGMSMITVASQNGFSGTVNLAASTNPAGPVPSLSPTSVTISSGGSTMSALTVSSTSSTLSGSYTVTVTGTSGSLSHPTSVAVTVAAPATQDFTINASPTTLNVATGSTATATITLSSVNGFSGSLGLTGIVTPSASGPSLSFSPSSVTLSSGGSATSTVTVSAVGGYYSSVATGNYSVNITATNGSLSRSTTFQVSVGSSTSPPPGIGNLPTTVLASAAVVIIAAAGVAVYLVRRKPALK